MSQEKAQQMELTSNQLQVTVTTAVVLPQTAAAGNPQAEVLSTSSTEQLAAEDKVAFGTGRNYCTENQKQVIIAAWKEAERMNDEAGTSAHTNADMRKRMRACIRACTHSESYVGSQSQGPQSLDAVV